MTRIVATARANIAFIKYWGKLERLGNYPAVPSLSVTLDGLVTRTELEPSSLTDVDQVELDGMPLEGRGLERVLTVLNACRKASGRTDRVRVVSHNHFPTSSGLASSASGFAALVGASHRWFGLSTSPSALSEAARQASASAARSVFGGWVSLDAGAEHACPLAPPEHWDLSVLVVKTTTAKKPLGSTEAMNLTRDTSPYYRPWLEHAPRLFEEAKQALLERDLERFGDAMEHSTFMMHASLLAARPSFTYLTPATLEILAVTRNLRDRGTLCFRTMDAGPHVKVLCRSGDAASIAKELREQKSVLDVSCARPGAGLSLEVIEDKP